VEDCKQQSHSITFQSTKVAEKRRTIGGCYERFKIRASPSETGQTGEAGKVIGSSVGVTEEAEDEPDRLIVESRVIDAGGMSRRRHGQPSEPRDLRMRHRNTPTDTRREDRLALEKRPHDLLVRLDEAHRDEEFTETPKKLRSLPDFG
jgi:hypothetical protein